MILIIILVIVILYQQDKLMEMEELLDVCLAQKQDYEYDFAPERMD